MNFTGNSSDIDDDVGHRRLSQESQIINDDEIADVISPHNPIEVLVSTLSKEKFPTESQPETLNLVEQLPPTPQPEKPRRVVNNPKTLRMIIQKPALININGPPLTEFGHSSFLNKT